MPGRNEPCTCGSGRKYKRCCGSGAVPNQSGSLIKFPIKNAKLSIDQLSFKEFRTATAEVLPLKFVRGKNDLFQNGLDTLSETELIEFDIELDLDGQLAAHFVFGVDGPDDYRSEFDSLGVVEIHVNETTIGGPLRFVIIADDETAEPDAHPEMVNATLVFLWLALADIIDRRKLPKPASIFHKKYQDALKDQAQILKQQLELQRQMAGVTLSSVSIYLEPLLVDGSPLSKIDAKLLELPDISPQSLAEPDPSKPRKSAFSPRRSSRHRIQNQGLPEVFRLEPDLAHQIPKNMTWSEKTPRVHRLAEAIKFHFSDGATVSVRCILHDPHAALLPPEFLPRSAKHARPEGSNLSSGFSLVSPVSHFPYTLFMENAVDQVMNTILTAVIEKAQSGDLQLHLKWMINGDQSCLNLRQLQLGTKGLFDWKLATAAQAMEENPFFNRGLLRAELRQAEPHSNARLIPLRNGFLCPETRSLWLTDLPGDLERLKSYGSDGNFDFPIRIQASGSSAKSQLIRDLRVAPLARLAPQAENDLKIKAAGAWTLKSEISLFPGGEFSLQRELQSPAMEGAKLGFCYLHGWTDQTLDFLS